MKSKQVRKIGLGIAGGMILAGLVSFTVIEDNYFEISRNLNIFATLYRELNTHYVDDIKTEELVTQGIDAMLKSLDPYTDYIPESELDNYRTSTTGEYGGIGAIVGKKNDVNTVIMPYKGFPAEQAGLQIGDQITHIDGNTLTTKSRDNISSLLKGQPGTSIILTIKRYGIDDPFDVTVERAKITISNVAYYGMFDETIGYVRLADFTTNASRELTQAINDLKEMGAQNLILDLRNNPGGLLDEAIKVANVFIAQGKEIVRTKGKVASWNKTYKAPGMPWDTAIPLVVLTSSGTASAAEIVSGVVQDYDRGVLIGQKTFGKGLVQATRPLPYNSQLKVTTAKYYIPSGRCIQAIDYSHKNADGSVGKIPDSLKVAFKTSTGRTVYDGGGIDPDIAVEVVQYTSMLYSLINSNLFFDFATDYHFRNNSIAKPRDFELSDQEYENFVAWLGDKNLSLTSEIDVAIKTLETIAKEEKYYDGMKPSIEQLKIKMAGVKQGYLVNYKSEVKYLLQEEIISRYYLHTGVMESAMDNDPAILKAVDVLGNKSQYSQILAKK